MEWWVLLIIVLGVLMALFLSGLPVAFAFLTFNIIGIVIWMGADSLHLMAVAILPNIGLFSFVTVPLFILMGELLFRTGLTELIITAIGKWLGKVRGSLSLAGVAAGTLFAMMSGSSISGVAVLGSTLIPEMRAKGYSKEMSIGPILGAGGLAMIIPPSILCVMVAILAQVNVGKLLIAGVIPGLILAGFYVVYILVRAHLQPHLAPSFAPPQVSWNERFKALAVASPLVIIIFLVLGLIFMGITTPSEAAATGAAGTLLLAIAYRKLTWLKLKAAILESALITGMVFMILLSSATFSQLLAYTGTSGALAASATGAVVPPIVMVIIMQLVMILLGMFVDVVSIIMITIPIFFPIIRALGFDPIWFGILMLVNIEMAEFSPPFGLLNFVMKGVVPDASMGDIVKSGIPFFLMGLVLLGVMLVAPSVVTWLPGLMGR